MIDKVDNMDELDNKDMSVDIIMPTYNPDLPLIKRAIQSITAQTYTNWTLFVAKDGGEVDLAPLMNELKDERIQFIELPHRGKSVSLNTAISMGSAPYIAYLDDDDIWYPNHLETVINAMREQNARFVYTNAYEVFLEKQGIGYKEVSRKKLGKGILTDLLLWYISHINVAHERALLDNAGLYDENKAFFIDWDMFIRLAKISKPHHCEDYTCEHFMYPKREAKVSTISGIHAQDPSLSEKIFYEMVARTYEILTPEDFAKIVHEVKWRSEYIQEHLNAEEQLEREISTLREHIQEHIDAEEKHKRQISALLNSVSWRVTKPLRKLGRIVNGISGKG
jgi:glycosyltransferase involved in cell wall biosynthesis